MNWDTKIFSPSHTKKKSRQRTEMELEEEAGGGGGVLKSTKKVIPIESIKRRTEKTTFLYKYFSEGR